MNSMLFRKLLAAAVCLMIVLAGTSCRMETVPEKEEETPPQEVQTQKPVRLTVESAEEPHQTVFENNDPEARELFENLNDALWNEKGGGTAEIVRYAYESIPDGWLEYDDKNLNYMYGFFADRGTELYYIELHMNGREKLLRIDPSSAYIEQLNRLLDMMKTDEKSE